jgi:hypothetical protein
MRNPFALQSLADTVEYHRLEVEVAVVAVGAAAVVVAGGGKVAVKPPVVLECRLLEQSSLGGMHRGGQPDSSLDLDHRPLQLAWTGAVETLSWAERDRPVCREGTPSLRWPRSGQEKSEPGRI